MKNYLLFNTYLMYEQEMHEIVLLDLCIYHDAIFAGLQHPNAARESAIRTGRLVGR